MFCKSHLDFKDIYLEQISNFNGFTSIDINFINKYNFSLNGSLPKNDDEIVITKLIEDTIKKYGIRDFNGIEKKNLESAINLEISIFGVKMKIVGVIDTKADISEYQNLKGDSIGDYMKMQLLNSYLENGPHLLFFVKDTMIDNLNKMYPNSNNTLEIEFNNQWFSYNKIVNSKENGNDFLNDKEILLPYSVMDMIDFFSGLNLNTHDEKYSKVMNRFLSFDDYDYYLYSMHKDEMVQLFDENNLEISKTFNNDYSVDSLENEKILYIFKVFQDNSYA